MPIVRRILIAIALLLTIQQSVDLRAEQRSRTPRLPYSLAQNIENVVPEGEVVPTPRPHEPADGRGRAGHFPALPPHPDDEGLEPLPPLDEELWLHGGAALYAPEGDRWNWPDECDSHYELLRLPEDWQKPRPLEGCTPFLGVGPIQTYPHLQWPACGYSWEPRFVGYGQYQIFGQAFEENNQRQDGIGHQLFVELDLRLTGTERFHAQFRPVGRENTGGSFYQFNDPDGYIDNSTITPDHYWFEGEVASIWGGFLDPFAVADVQFVLGRFPFALHNNLLMNTDLLGAVVNKNTIFLGNLSNMNVQLFAAREDIAAFVNADGYVYGTNISADYRHAFYELTYAFLQHESDDTQDSHFAAISRTQLYGPWTIATRALFKFGGAGGTGDGQLFVIESNRTRYFDSQPLGIEFGVCYCNAFVATDGWRPLSGGGYNRLRASFEVNPLITISAGTPVGDNWGAALGVQLFRHHQDESIIPEIAVQSPGDKLVFGCGLRYLRKTSARSFFEILGILNISDDPQYDREGVFIGETIIF